MKTELLSVGFGDCVWLYILYAAIASLLVRIVACLMRASEKHNGGFADTFWASFKGKGSSDPNTDDHWQTFLLGFLEMCAFPVLFISGNASYIGAWLVLKTFPKWGHWKYHRSVYNRFLINNGLIVALSYWLTRVCLNKI